MFATSLLVIPILALVVMAALLVTSSRSTRSLTLGFMGVVGVILGGPSAMLLVGAEASEAAVDGSPVRLTPAIDLRFDKPDTESKVEKSGRPEWITTTAPTEGAQTRVVSSGPHVYIEDGRRALNEQLKAETDEYIRSYLGHDEAPYIIDLDLRYINTHLRQHDKSYHELREYTVGPMHTTYTMLEFDERFHAELDKRWEEEVAKNRLIFAALAGGGVFMLLCTVFAYFRLDNATRGFYTGRLQFIAVGAILALLAAGVLAVKWTGIDWLW